MDINNNIITCQTALIRVLDWAINIDRLWAFLFVAFSALLCSLSDAVYSLVVLVFPLVVRRNYVWIRSQSAFMSPVVGSELPRGAPLCMPMPLQLSGSTQLDSSSSVSVSHAVFVRLVHAHPALSLVSIPGVLVKTALFPFLGTFSVVVLMLVANL